MEFTGKRITYMGRAAVQFSDSTFVIVGRVIHKGRTGDFDYYQDSATQFYWREEVK